jgi:hypothetical protein
MNQDWFWMELSPDGDGSSPRFGTRVPLVSVPKPEGLVLLDRS